MPGLQDSSAVIRCQYHGQKCLWCVARICPYITEAGEQQAKAVL